MVFSCSVVFKFIIMHPNTDTWCDAGFLRCTKIPRQDETHSLRWRPFNFKCMRAVLRSKKVNSNERISSQWIWMKHRKTATFSFLICVRHFATPKRRYLLKRQLSPHFNGNSICSISQGWKSNYSQHPSLHDLFLKDISLFSVNEQISQRISATHASGPSSPPSLRTAQRPAICVRSPQGGFSWWWCDRWCGGGVCCVSSCDRADCAVSSSDLSITVGTLELVRRELGTPAICCFESVSLSHTSLTT